MRNADERRVTKTGASTRAKSSGKSRTKAKQLAKGGAKAAAKRGTQARADTAKAGAAKRSRSTAAPRAKAVAKAQGGLVCAYAIDKTGAAKPLKEPIAHSTPKGAAWVWLHFGAEDEPTAAWLNKDPEIDKHITVALTATGTRPRFEKRPAGFLLVLRGVNLNPGRDPEDMVSIRLWVEKDRVITTRREKVLAIMALRNDYDAGKGHETPGGLLIALAGGLVARMNKEIAELEEEIDNLEEITDDSVDAGTRRGRVRRLRISTIMLRRYLAPQRQALSDFMAERLDVFDEDQRGSMRLVTDRIVRYVEDLDAIRDRALAVHEEITAQLAEQMNATMFRLSIVATIFLPLSLLTGLLGINVGGMPGVESGAAFTVVTLALVAMGVGGYWLMKKWDMI